MTNQYAGRCIITGKYIPAGEGVYNRSNKTLVCKELGARVATHALIDSLRPGHIINVIRVQTSDGKFALVPVEGDYISSEVYRETVGEDGKTLITTRYGRHCDYLTLVALKATHKLAGKVDAIAMGNKVIALVVNGIAHGVIPGTELDETYVAC